MYSQIGSVSPISVSVKDLVTLKISFSVQTNRNVYLVFIFISLLCFRFLFFHSFFLVFNILLHLFFTFFSRLEKTYAKILSISLCCLFHLCEKTFSHQLNAQCSGKTIVGVLLLFAQHTMNICSFSSWSFLCVVLQSTTTTTKSVLRPHKSANEIFCG